MDIRPQTEFTNHALVITVSSDSGRPVLDAAAYARLARTLREAAEDDETRVVVLRGLAGCFCLGGDFGEFVDPSKHQALIGAVTDMFRTLATFPKPLIASVDGDAVGVGCTILFHCDLVIASRKSTFRVPFVDFGLVPDAATSILAPEKLGYAGAFRFFCLGEALDVDRACAMALVSSIAEDDPEAEALATARVLAKKPVRSLTQTKALLKGDAEALCRRIDREITLFHHALQDEKTLRRLKRVARMAA
ncbi:enoyl-CoA hydratase-related protein [Aquibium sp. A9E412]|uniref:enoyl-CoA hydratase-related protein n=1 Tax=Aquibium sp. A9E412 TaxID=2976767 RepID=UPI0025B168F5|nr:enoyl-CoA hydratase-related protein [Aquibium sp. A9E412]MDN2566702.1 enoyl-CoA hydratase-related protein [Aquibium sp. A9E412]